MLIHYYAEVSEIAATFMVLAFVVQWTYYSPWWKDPVGRTFVYKDVALFLALAPLVVNTFFHFTLLELKWLQWFDVSAIALIPVILGWRMIVWHRINKGRRNEHVQEWIRLLLRRNREHDGGS